MFRFKVGLGLVLKSSRILSVKAGTLKICSENPFTICRIELNMNL